MSRALVGSLALAVLLALAGCAAPQQLQGSGVPTPAPQGYDLDCKKTPTAARCQ